MESKTGASTWVLGVAASHNGAACLLRDGEVVVAIQEERVTRQKRAFIEGHDDSFAIRYCLDRAGIEPAQLAAAVVCSPLGAEYTHIEKNPFLELERHGVPLWTMPHHLGHAVAAFATSGFHDAAVLIVDGMGSPWSELPEDERAVAVVAPHLGDDRSLVHEHASLYDARGTSLAPLEKHVSAIGRIVKRYQAGETGVPPFESLGGIFNSAAVQIFGQFHEAGKVMGLAPFGEPTIPVAELFSFDDGTFRFHELELSRFEKEAVAASAQAAVEAGVLLLVQRLRATSKSTNLVYAGGVALNSITNERIVREGGFDAVYIMPAAEDSGTAIGAAYYGAWKLGAENLHRRLERDAVGRPYTVAEIDHAIDDAPSVTRVAAPSAEASIAKTVELLVEGKILGWFEGGSELGPRALGQRSLLCDPRPAGMKDHLNARVKFREGFRPFAPMVLREDVCAWFDIDDAQADSPFMLRICDVRPDKRARVPAVVHVDGTGRLQTITRASHPALHAVISAFKAKTGVPILLNTSFNVAGEPIVETPDDALWCMLYTGVDACVLEGRIVTKRPGYTSILDLEVRRGPISLGRTFPAHDRTELLVETRYGTRRDHVLGDVLEILERLGAPVAGHELALRLGWDEARLIRKLGELRRAGIVALHDREHTP